MNNVFLFGVFATVTVTSNSSDIPFLEACCTSYG